MNKKVPKETNFIPGLVQTYLRMPKDGLSQSTSQVQC